MIIIDLQSSQEPFEKTQKRLARIPKIVRSSIDNWGNNYLTPMMKRSAFEEGDKLNSYTGMLEGGISWKDMAQSNTGVLTMPSYGVFQDGIKEHYVWVNPYKHNFLQWCLDRGNAEIMRKAKLVQEGKLSGFSVRVRPHPFIGRGIGNARNILPEVLQSDFISANI